MKNVRKVKEDLYFIGVNDRRIELFENIYPVENGVSYNSYVLLDEKNVLFDTVDKTAGEDFIENLTAVLDGKNLDYIVVNHMEPDHCAMLSEVVYRYPEAKVVCNQKTVNMIKQFFDFDIDSRALIVKENDTLNTGKHTLAFVMAPMVHWPEAMVTYDVTDKILFSADAFGTFGAIDGNLYTDEVNYENGWIDENRRYFTNIVGKYGPQVQALLKKAATLDIELICPLHGHLWRDKDDIGMILDKYNHWSTYEAEENSVMVVYASVYGNTAKAANALADKIADKGVKNVKVYDASKTDPSYILSDAFKYKTIVFASVTYNNEIFPKMETLLHEIAAHNLQNRNVAFIENGTWGPMATKKMKAIVEKLKNINYIDGDITIKSALSDENVQQLDVLAENIVNEINK
ncbi:FprA family A-type flavoprotein [Anaerofustis sp. NSJ-163]|uniref:FprA family A-type flavoprotein n=1 Tax=Anaerofustis sp. NSJ-163 TaxID=2944391 RepID=UPI00209C6855|nr:FprA family A-type flavoprotein [Anaerofustis sp. NSJ-163]MCO8193102.1 FprA family A-type flavoprotein [Anaerofustis sp. NSJ-163]